MNQHLVGFIYLTSDCFMSLIDHLCVPNIVVYHSYIVFLIIIEIVGNNSNNYNNSSKLSINMEIKTLRIFENMQVHN